MPPSDRCPDQVLERDPFVLETPCPHCDGVGWVESPGSHYHSAIQDTWYPGLNVTYRPCCRCHATGQVLDYALPLPLEDEDALPVLAVAA